MKRTKVLIYLLLVLCLIVSFAGCSSNPRGKD